MLDSGFGVMPGGDIGGGAGAGNRPRLQFSIPCLEVRDRDGDKSIPPCFMYVFYEMPFPQFPFSFPEGQGFFVANGWCNGLGKHVQRMRILSPDKQMLVDTNDQPFELKKPDEPFMAINFISGMQFEKPGTYWIHVLLDGQVALEYPLPVRKADNVPS